MKVKHPHVAGVDNNHSNSETGDSSIGAGYELKKNRGRPRKTVSISYHINLNQGAFEFGGATPTSKDSPYQMMGRSDPNSDMFMKVPEKLGGPTDPFTGFEETVASLFPSRYPDFTQHPMFVFLSQYSFKSTPIGPSEQERYLPGRRFFRDVTREINSYSENKKNMLNCEQIFTIYLREYS